MTILDDLVLDIGLFEKFHPGGAFVIALSVGRDISEYFHGGYSFTDLTENPGDSITKYVHSNNSIIIANGLAIARISTEKK